MGIHNIYTSVCVWVWNEFRWVLVERRKALFWRGALHFADSAINVCYTFVVLCRVFFGLGWGRVVLGLSWSLVFFHVCLFFFWLPVALGAALAGAWRAASCGRLEGCCESRRGVLSVWVAYRIFMVRSAGRLFSYHGKYIEWLVLPCLLSVLLAKTLSPWVAWSYVSLVAHG